MLAQKTMLICYFMSFLIYYLLFREILVLQDSKEKLDPKEKL